MESLNGPGGTLEKVKLPSVAVMAIRGEESTAGWLTRVRVTRAAGMDAPSPSVM
jgi:hypothetical protein